jgi:hypothetical protein
LTHKHRSNRENKTFQTRVLRFIDGRENAQTRIRYGYRHAQIMLRREGWRSAKTWSILLRRGRSSKWPRRRKTIVLGEERFKPKQQRRASVYV